MPIGSQAIDWMPMFLKLAHRKDFTLKIVQYKLFIYCILERPNLFEYQSPAEIEMLYSIFNVILSAFVSKRTKMALTTLFLTKCL